MDLIELQRNRASLTVEWAGFVINLEYRPDLVTGETQRSLFTLADTGDPSPLYGEVVKLVCAWDMTNQGQSVPLTVDAIIGTVPLPLVGRVVGAILQDVSAPKNVTSSPSGPNLTAGSASALTGLVSSGTPNGHMSPHGISPDSPAPAIVSAGMGG